MPARMPSAVALVVVAAYARLPPVALRRLAGGPWGPTVGQRLGAGREEALQPPAGAGHLHHGLVGGVRIAADKFRQYPGEGVHARGLPIPGLLAEEVQ